MKGSDKRGAPCASSLQALLPWPSWQPQPQDLQLPRTSRSTRHREPTRSALSKEQREALLRHASRESNDPSFDAMNRAVVEDLLNLSDELNGF